MNYLKSFFWPSVYEEVENVVERVEKIPANAIAHIPRQLIALIKKGNSVSKNAILLARMRICQHYTQLNAKDLEFSWEGKKWSLESLENMTIKYRNEREFYKSNIFFLQAKIGRKILDDLKNNKFKADEEGSRSKYLNELVLAFSVTKDKNELEQDNRTANNEFCGKFLTSNYKTLAIESFGDENDLAIIDDFKGLIKSNRNYLKKKAAKMKEKEDIMDWWIGVAGTLIVTVSTIGGGGVSYMYYEKGEKSKVGKTASVAFVGTVLGIVVLWKGSQVIIWTGGTIRNSWRYFKGAKEDEE